MSQGTPSRGELWLVDLNPTRGHEQAGRRPALVVSVDELNHGPAELVILAPLTTRDRGLPLHVAITPPEAALTQPSFIKCEDVRSVSKERLVRRIGVVAPATLAEVEDRLRLLLDL